jgi:hypothetical protein
MSPAAANIMSPDSTPRRYETEVIWLPELAREFPLIERAEFRNCTMLGPAVVAPLGSTEIRDCTFEGDPSALLWEIPESRPNVIGAIGLESCIFVSCVFSGIGFAGPASVLEHFRSTVQLTGALETAEASTAPT